MSVGFENEWPEPGFKNRVSNFQLKGLCRKIINKNVARDLLLSSEFPVRKY